MTSEYLIIFLVIRIEWSTACHKALFSPVPESRHPGRVIQKTVDPVTVTQCQRLCRMYSECYGCNMQWSDDVYGYCEVLDVSNRTAYNTPGYLNQAGYTYYGNYPC